MRIILLFSAAIAMLGGCAADTMKGYVGRDIRAVELDYGPPSGEIDLGGGTRAFQWQKISVDTTPVSAVTRTEKDRRGRKTSETQYTGGDRSVTKCLYTFLTNWNPARNGWIVTGIRQPSFDCAIGGLS